MSEPVVFVGYRRDDVPDVTGRIYDRLAGDLGRDNVFKDVDSLPLGEAFGPFIEAQLERCDVFLAIIGPRWHGPTDGRVRLHDADDWVRTEVEAALRLGTRVVPVLVNGAPLPDRAHLPPSLHPLLDRNAARIERDPDFHVGMDRLIRGIRRLGSSPTAPPEPIAPRPSSEFLVALRERLVEVLPERWSHGRGTRTFTSTSLSFQDAVRERMGADAGSLSLVLWCEAPPNDRTSLAVEVFEAPRGFDNDAGRRVRHVLKQSLAEALARISSGVASPGSNNIVRRLPLDVSQATALRDAGEFAVAVDRVVEAWVRDTLPEMLPRALAAGRATG